jgi:hypothetical protein
MEASASPRSRNTALLAASLLLAASAVAEAGWYTPAGWQYRKKLTLNGSLVQGTQTDFPVLVALTDPDSHLQANAQASGNDILFTAADGTAKLAHEIERYDAATGALVAWVKVPTLTNGTNTVLYMYYGNAGAANQQSPTAVWDAGYEAVWHLGTSLADSTSVANHGTDSGGSTVVAGAVGQGRSFDGVDDYVYTANGASVSYTNLTIEAWVRTTTATGYPIVSWEGVNQTGTANTLWDAGLYVDTAADLRFYVFQTSGYYPVATGSYNDGLWHHVVGVSDVASGSTRIYVDGAERGTDGREDTNPIGTRYWRIGSYKNIGSTLGADGFFNGQVDEVRISTNARPASWIGTAHSNQANQGVGATKFILSATLEGASARLKLVQSGSLTIGAGSATATATLNPVVDLARSFLVFGVSSPSGDSPDDALVTGRISATNTVTFQRLATADPVSVQWYVAEFASGVTVQRGTTNLTACGATCDVTLPTAVDAGRSFAIVSQRKDGVTFDSNDFVRARVTGPTTLALRTALVGGTDVVEWQVVEYEAASVQSGSLSLAYDETSKAVSLATPAATSKSWLLYTYSCGPSGGCTTVENGSKLVRGLVTNATTLTFDRSIPSPTTTDVIDIDWQLVTFGDATWVQHGSQAFAAGGATAVDVALPRSVSPAASIASAGGYTRGGRSTLDDLGLPVEGWFTLQLDKPKNLRIARGGNGFDADVGWFLVTFPRYEIYGAPALGALGPTGCPAGTYRSATNLIPNGAFVTSGGGPAAQPLAASQFTVDPRQTAPAWGWAGDNALPNDTQFTMVSGAWCYDFGNNFDCNDGDGFADVARQGAFPGDPGFGLSPAACALAGNPPTGAYNPDYPGCWGYGNGNSYATAYKIWETRGTVGLTAGRTYTFVAYASDAIKPGGGYTPPQLSVKKSLAPCTTNAGTIAAICGGTAPVDMNPVPFAVPQEFVDTSDAFNPGEIWTRYQATFAATATENAYFSIWDPTLGVGGVDVAFAQVGLYTCDATTEVELTSFTAAGVPSGILLDWQTGSELDNLGFHVHRSTSEAGPWQRLTSSLIPGLGSSAVGQSYSWLDGGLANGVTYCYRLEDVDTKSVSTWHGPVCTALSPPVEDGGGGGGGDSAEREGDSVGDGPSQGPGEGPGESPCPPWVLSLHGSLLGDPSTPVRCSPHGDPESVSLSVLGRSSRSVDLELQTGGFWSVTPSDSGGPGPEGPAGSSGLRAYAKGFDSPLDPSSLAVPVRHALVDAVVGRQVRLGSFEVMEERPFPGLRPSLVGSPDLAVSRDGTVRPSRRTVSAPRSPGLSPSHVARLGGTLFQGERKRAVIELAPLRYDSGSGALVLATRLRVRLLFAGVEPGETGTGSTGRRASLAASSSTLVQLHATRRGLHAVRFEEVFPGRVRGLPASGLRLQRDGQAVALRVAPRPDLFGPGSTLYFHVDRKARSTDFTGEVAYELVKSRSGVPMGVVAGTPEGAAVTTPALGLVSEEVNRIYQPGLLEASDVWLWEALPSPSARTTAVRLEGIDPSASSGRVVVFLQGASESGSAADHHVRVQVNGVAVGEATLAGKRPFRLEAEVPAGLLREGSNDLLVENVGDTGVASLVFLDRWEVLPPRKPKASEGVFRGQWTHSGTVEVLGLEGPATVLDVTEGRGEPSPRWLTGVVPIPDGVASRRRRAASIWRSLRRAS